MYDIKNIARIRLRRGIKKNSNKMTIDVKEEDLWVNAGELNVNENAKVVVWIKYGDIDTSADTPIFSGFVTSVGLQSSSTGKVVSIDVVDAVYVLLNKVWARGYNGWTAPEIVKDIVNSVSDKGNGEYYIDARLKSEGGFIEDTRADGSPFPAIDLSLGIKPVYEWLQEASSITSVNSSAEIDAAATGAGALPEPRPFIFWIDEDNAFHWERSSTVPSFTIDVTEAAQFKIGKSSEDSFNHVVYTIKSDLNGNTIYGHVLADDIRGPLKQVHIPMNWIAEHAPDSVRTDNATFVDYCKRVADSVALKLLSDYGRQRSAVDMVITGVKVHNYMYNVGSVAQIVHPNGYKKIMRIETITHNIDRNGWTASVSLREDPEDISKYLVGG